MKKLILSTCFSLFAVAVFAQDEEQLNDSILVTDLDEVVVSGFSVADLAKERVTQFLIQRSLLVKLMIELETWSYQSY